MSKQDLNIITKQTLVPVGIVMSVIGFAFLIGSTISELKTTQKVIIDDVNYIKTDYVPRAEYTATVVNMAEALQEIRNYIQNNDNTSSFISR